MGIIGSLKTFIKKGDLLLLLLCTAASLFGLILICSASRYLDTSTYVLKQLSAILIGIILYAALSLLDIDLLIERAWKYCLIFNILLILILIPFGNEGGTGNKSWIELPFIPFNLQPAEIVKITFVLLFSRQLIRLRKDGEIRSLSAVFQVAAHAGFMCVLIFAVSRDAGMALVYFILSLVMAFIAGVRLRFFAAGAVLLAGAGYLGWPHLPEYIRMRFLVVFDHSLDPLNIGFHQNRSLLAIGSGQFWGQGLFQGTQTQSAASSSLPARHTDFIFSVAGEELGLFGCILIILVLLAIIIRCIAVSRRAGTPLASLAACGYAAMLAIQAVMNIGMCLYVAPVVGLTLPFFSYGGSSILTLYAAMGLVSGVKLHSPPSWLR